MTSSSAVLLLKALFNGSLGTSPFQFPLTITATSNIVSALLSYFISPPPTTSSPSSRRYGMVIGAATAGEIGLSNWALGQLTVTLATMLKGAAPLLVLLWGIWLGVYVLDYRRVAVVVVVCAGLALAVFGQSDAQASRSALQFGVAAQLCSGALSGIRWVITQVFVKGDQEHTSALLEALQRGAQDQPKGPLAVVRYTAPCTAAVIAPFAIALEAVPLMNWFIRATALQSSVVLVTALAIGSCVCALLWSEYALVKSTSSLTVSVGFVAKEVFMIGAGIALFGDKLSLVSALGFCLAQAGIMAYSSQMKTESSTDIPR